MEVLSSLALSGRGVVASGSRSQGSADAYERAGQTVCVVLHVIIILDIIVFFFLLLFWHTLTMFLVTGGAVTLGDSIIARTIASRVIDIRMRRGSKEVVGVFESLSISFHRWSYDTSFPA